MYHLSQLPRGIRALTATPDDTHLPTREHERLALFKARRENWQRWGTYLPERQWGTVREDYSAEGDPWSFTHDMARYRAYRWGEDGLLGWTDRQCRLCFSLSLWNGRDPIIKERLFGLSNPEGNHGEDVKELYYYLDATPTHSYARALYKYPQGPYPYEDIVRINDERGLEEDEYELLDTGLFQEDRYFDVEIEYAKAAPEDTLIRITIANRGPEPATLAVLPTLVLRNNWSWRTLEAECETRPWMAERDGAVVASHEHLGRFRLVALDADGASELLFTENDTNAALLDEHAKGVSGFLKRAASGLFKKAASGFFKDAFNRYLVDGEEGAVNLKRRGTKAAFLHRLTIVAGAETVLHFRLVREDEGEPGSIDAAAADRVFAERRREADLFYDTVIALDATSDERAVSRQAYAGLLWSKQFYYYVAERWGAGEPAQLPPPDARNTDNSDNWRHLFCRDVLSVPDKWEYPWFAAWDLAFHMVPMAKVDPGFAKNQIILLLREWYLHPNGQMPAYEGSWSDVNPPVHAFAAFQVYAIDAKTTGRKDIEFLERAFQKLLLNFTWWVNRNDADGRDLFGGGFLGLDNIGVFDRNTLPEGADLAQADATAWMGLFCAAMLRIAVELAQVRPIYQDIASKFLGHYTAIVEAMNADDGTGLWNEEDGFYFDRLTCEDGTTHVLKVHSIVGIVPLFGVVSLRKQELDAMPGFRQRMDWLLEHSPRLGQHVTPVESEDPALEGSFMLSLVPKDRMVRTFKCVLDEALFFSPHGIRSVSQRHGEHPYEIELGGKRLKVDYVPGVGNSYMFGGNSNWRGPVWFPISGLLVNALDRYQAAYGDGFKVECPTGTGRMRTLREVADELSGRMVSLFLPDAAGRRPCHGDERRYAEDPNFRDLVLFNEFFCGDTGKGIGASHQTGWTAMAATLIDDRHRRGLGMF